MDRAQSVTNGTARSRRPSSQNRRARRLARSLRICSPEVALRSRARIPLEGVARVATSVATSLADRRKFMVRVPENPPQGCPVSLLAASRYNPWASRSVVQIHSPRLSSHNDLGLRWSACCHRSGANPFAATRSYKDLANPVLGLRCHCRCHFSRRAPGFTPRLSSPTSVCTGSGAGCGNFNRRCTAITVHPHRYGGQTSVPAA